VPCTTFSKRHALSTRENTPFNKGHGKHLSKESSGSSSFEINSFVKWQINRKPNFSINKLAKIK
jgi:hypothetical protein